MRTIRGYWLLAAGALAVCPHTVQAEPATTVRAKPNILLIAVDDLNDWIGCMGGHSQAKTPTIRYTEHPTKSHGKICQAWKDVPELQTWLFSQTKKSDAPKAK